MLLDEDLDKYFENAVTDHEKYFFNLAIKARNKINKWNFYIFQFIILVGVDLVIV